MKKPGAGQPKSPPKPRNVAARALREGQFQPKVEPDPRVYRRRPKHRDDLLAPNDEIPGDETKD